MKNLIIVLLITLASTASARIGETYQQCVKRYGKHVSTKPVPGMPVAYHYKKNGWKITICYVSSVAVSVVYARVDGKDISETTSRTLVKVNLPNVKFKRTEGMNVGPQFKYVWKYQAAEKALMIINLPSIQEYKKARSKRETNGL